MILNEGDILVHEISGTFAEISESANGYVLGFTVRYGGKVNVSKTKSYSISEIATQWRHIKADEIHMFKKGKLSIWG